MDRYDIVGLKHVSKEPEGNWVKYEDHVRVVKHHGDRVRDGWMATSKKIHEDWKKDYQSVLFACRVAQTRLVSAVMVALFGWCIIAGHLIQHAFTG